MAVTIRLLLDHESELANNFFNDTYKTNRTIENFKWEFIDGPKGKAIYVIAVDESDETPNKIVGIQCAIPIELFRPDGTKILTAKSEDTLVHPGYRGQKLFERMYDLLFAECRKAGINYIWGFTPALKAFERIGFKAPFQTSQALLVIEPLKAYKYLVKLNPSNNTVAKLKILLLCLMSYVRGLKRFFTASHKLSQENIQFHSKDELLTNFYGNSSALFFLHQNNEYLNWRLIKNPFNNSYKNVQFRKNGTVVADLIVNSRKEVSYVEQMFFSRSLPAHERQNIVDAVTRELARQSPLVRALCFETNNELLSQIRQLKKAGFTYLKRGSYFVWKELNEQQPIAPQDLFLSRLFTQGNL